MAHSRHKKDDEKRIAIWNIKKTEANSLRKKAQDFTNKSAKAAFDFGALLYEIYFSDIKVGKEVIPVWRAWGYETWFLYCECELHMHAATVNSYRNVYDIFGVQLDGMWNKKDILPITKMRSLLKVVNENNVKSWVKKAKKLSCCDLDDEVEYALTGKKTRLRHFTARMDDKSFTEVKNIISDAREDFDGLDKGEVMARIFRQWNHMHKSAKRFKKGKGLKKAS